MDSRRHHLAAWSSKLRLAAGWLLLWAALSGAGEAWAQDLFCTTTTYETTGSCSTMLLQSPWTVGIDLYTIHSDAVARRWGDTIFVVNRYLADNILVLDAANGYAVIDQYSTGLNSNPYDLEVVRPGRAYIPRYEETTLWVVEPLHGTLLATVDLSLFADADGIPEMAQVAAVGDFAFVSLQRLDRNSPYLPPAGGSSLAVIDTRTDQVVDADPSTPQLDPIVLPAENPSGDLWYDRHLNRLLVVCSGNFLVADGGLVVVNPFTRQSEGFVATESQLGGDLQAARLASADLGWAIVSDASFRTLLLRFDVASGAVLDTVLTPAGFDLSDLEISDTGRVYVADRSAQAPGVRVYDAQSAQLLSGPNNVGLPPFDIVLRDGSPEGPVVDAPPARPRARLRAWPNPFNPRVTIAWEGDVSAWSPQDELEIVDARGRVVASLRGTLGPAGAGVEGSDSAGGSGAAGAVRYVWDGRDRQGRQVASGVYWARLRVASGEVWGVKVGVVR